MSSFYGAGGNVTVNVSGSGGTSEDSAIATLTGTSSSPIVLNTLDYGNYLVEGYYRYTSSSDKISTDYQILITIMEDTVTSNKIAKFETYEDGIFYIYTINFDNNSYTENKQTFALATEVADLPSTGTSGILYVVGTTLYLWSEDDQDYVEVGSSITWESL